MNIGQLIATLGVDTAGLAAATVAMRGFEAQANKSIASVNAKLMASGKIMKKFGRNASMYLTAPILLVGGAATKMYKDFEASLSKIVGLVGVAKSQVDAWGETILKMAPRLGKAPKELADALFFITSAGIRGAEAMDILEQSAKASAGGLGETKVVADLVTSAMNAYGKETLNASMATDVLVAAVREGKAQADDLAGSMGMVLPIASAMGVSFAQVGGAVAAMTRTGTKARTASMQLRQMLAALLKPAQQAEKAMWNMGTSSAALRKTIREDGLLAALMKIRELTNKYGEDTMAKVFPNIRALSGVLDIMGSNLEDNIAIFKSLENATGSLDGAFGAASSTLDFKLKQAVAAARTTLTVFGKTIAESIIPLLKNITERLKNATYWFDGLTNSQRQLIIKLVALLAALGPVALILGVLVGTILPGMLRVGMAVITMIKSLTVAMLTNPATALAVALGLVAASLMLIAKRAKDAREALTQFEKISNTAIENTIEQRKQVEQLLKIAQDEQEVLEKRQAALKQLNRISPEYFGNLKLETLNINKVTEAKKKYIEELIREAKVKAAQEEIMRLERERYKKIEQLEGARLKFFQLTGATFVQMFRGSSNAISYMVRKGMENVKEVEGELDVAQKKVEEFLQTLMTGKDIPGLFGGGEDPGGGIVTAVRTVEGVLKTLAVEMEFARDMEKVMGHQFDETTFMIDAQTSALQELLRLGVDPTNTSIKDIVQNITDLKLLADTAWFDIDQMKMFADAEWEATVQAALLNEAVAKQILTMHGLGEKSFELASIVENVFQGMSNAISNAFQSTENVLQAFGKFFGDFIKGMIFKLIAATIAALALAVVLTFIMPGNIGKIFEGLSEASKFGDIFKAGLKSFTGMQHGGVVPAGYPGDSFPAMLSSGEEVIPAGQMSQRGVQVNLIGSLDVDMHNLRVALEQVTDEHNMTT